MHGISQFLSREMLALGRGKLSTPFHKYDHVCGEGFLAQTRRERRAYPSEGSVRSEQRRLGQKEPPPGGLRRFSVLASLLLTPRLGLGGASNWDEPKRR